MRKKIKLFIITIFLAIACIAGIIEIGKIFNVKESNTKNDNLKQITANAYVGEEYPAGSLENGADTSEMYNFIPGGDTFCAGKGWALTIRSQYSGDSTKLPDPGSSGGRKEEVIYKHSWTTEMAQSIAYARAFGGSSVKNEEIQRLVWASGVWSSYTNGSCLVDDSDVVEINTESSGIEGRATQFANFVYRALNGDGKLGLSISKGNQNVNIIVNQYDQTYTVGPYTISIDNQDANLQNGTGYGTIGDLVYKEIMGYNTGYSEANAFCVGSVGAQIIYESGNSANTQDVVVLDENGYEIKFPRFGQKFYIKYKSGDAEIKKIKPSIQINYLKKITNNGFAYYADTYESEKVTFKMFQDPDENLASAIRSVTYGMNFNKYNGENPFWLVSYDPISFSFFGMWNKGDSIEEKMKNLEDDCMKGVKNGLSLTLNDWEANDLEVDLEAKKGVWYKGIFYEISETTKHTESEPKSNNNGGFTCESHLDPDPNIPGLKTSAEASADTSKEAKLKAMQALATTLDASEVSIAIQITDITISMMFAKIQPFTRLDFVASYEYYRDWQYTEGNVSTIYYGAEKVTYSNNDDDDDDEIDMYLGGNVWQDMPTEKIGDYTGQKRNNSLNLGGIQVQLYDTNSGTIKATTTTDSFGYYGFRKLNPMHKYKVIFTYDGMRFENTAYKDDLSGGYSTARESYNDRNTFNDYFDEIASSPGNYYKNGQWRKAYRSIY